MRIVFFWIAHKQTLIFMFSYFKTLGRIIFCDVKITKSSVSASVIEVFFWRSHSHLFLCGLWSMLSNSMDYQWEQKLRVYKDPNICHVPLSEKYHALKHEDYHIAFLSISDISILHQLPYKHRLLKSSEPLFSEPWTTRLLLCWYVLSWSLFSS